MKKHDGDPPACADCVHFDTESLCWNDACSTFDVVKGRQPVEARAARRSYPPCGPEGREFKERAKPNFIGRNWLLIILAAFLLVVLYKMFIGD